MSLMLIAAAIANKIAEQVEKLKARQDKQRDIFRNYMKDLAGKYKSAKETDSKKESAYRLNLVEETALKIFEPESTGLEQVVRVYDIAKKELPKSIVKKIAPKITSKMGSDCLYELMNGRINGIEYTIHEDIKEAARMKYYEVKK